MKTKPAFLISCLAFALLLPVIALSQVNTGSDGSDGALNPTADIVINMADHPSGVYKYSSVIIPNNVTVTFIPNASNTPVYWLVQSNVVINGTIDVRGQNGSGAQCGPAPTGGLGGPGGWAGGNGSPSITSGQGPGGGQFAIPSCITGWTIYESANASFGNLGTTNYGCNSPGPTYGNIFLIPLMGGSGGSGTSDYSGVGGGGGGGAILIAASGSITLIGPILADAGSSSCSGNCGAAAGGGSGGAVRLVAAKITGTGGIYTRGGAGGCTGHGGDGRVRFDTYENDFSGPIVHAVFTQGSQFIINPSSGQIPQLTVASIGGVSVSAPPSGALSTPDAVISSQQNNPIPVVVQCANLPLNTQVTVSVKPMNGSPVSAIGYNNTGTSSSSTATVLLNIPRGGGIIYATAATSN